VNQFKALRAASICYNIINMRDKTGYLIGTILGLWVALFTLSAHAQNQSEAQNFLEVRTTDREEFDVDPIRLERLEIQGSQAGNVANFTVTAIIANTDDGEEIEGEFILPLPQGAIINDYALDIEGRLIDGVLTQRERARKAYTDKVTQGIDPGLAEKLSDNRYRTAIYPILEESRRTIRMGFAVPLGGAQSWDLKSDIKAGHLVVKAPDFGLRSDSRDANIDLQFPLQSRKDNFKSKRIQHPVAGDFAFVALSESERNSADINTAADIRKLAVIWDNSLSRRDDDHRIERDIISDLIQTIAPETTELIIGNDRIVRRKTYDSALMATALRTDILTADYDGGTRIPSLLPADLSADVCILFSDGNSISSGAFAIPNCPVITISGAADMNAGFLTMLAERTGGQFLSLDTAKNSGLPTTLPPALSSSDLINPRWIGDPKDGLIMGRLKETSDRSVSISVKSGKTVKTFRHRLDRKDTHKGLPTMWANQEAEYLRAIGASVSEVIDFSRPFSIAGLESALIVLEEPYDYVEAKIPPPATYPKELMEEYEEEQADHLEDLADNLLEKEEDVAELAEEIRDWYSELYNDYDPSEWPLKDVAEPASNALFAPPPPPPPPPPQVSAPLDSRVPDVVVPTGNVFERESENDEIIVTAHKRQPVTGIILPRVWTPDRPYLKAMDRASSKRLENVYQDQRQTYGNLPAFYLESADLFYREGLKDRASQIVQGAMELSSANVQTFTQVGHRLLSYKDYDRAVEIYEHVVSVSPDLPYAYYNLAVALHDRALHHSRNGTEEAALSDLKRSLKNLEHVLREKWNWDFEGIETVALVEANNVFQKLPRSDRQKSHYKRLIRKPVQGDLRVVVDWNTDYTDLDLWVEEPSGETAYYGNSDTLIGGFLSNDMTEGYGPEQYLLNYAPPGTYKIRVKYFSDSEYDPNGPVTLRARITQYFGSDDQETQTIIMELSDDKEEQLVGQFVVE